jgi:hypothetical protein
MRLYVDDQREAPDGYTVARSPDAALKHLASGGVTHVSLDYDFAPTTPAPGGGHVPARGTPTGLDIVKAMVAGTVPWPTQSLRVHSGNPEGAQAMKALIRQHAPAHLQRPTQSPYTLAAKRLTRRLTP